jgi:hypothetical protein
MWKVFTVDIRLDVEQLRFCEVREAFIPAMILGGMRIGLSLDLSNLVRDVGLGIP